MQVENLNDENLSDLVESVEKIEKENPLVTHKIFPMDDLDMAKQIKELKSEVELLKTIIDEQIARFINTFDGHVLIKGRWMKPDITDV